jgi:hypothetical protein
MPEIPKACVRCATPYGLARQPVAFRAGLRRFRVDLPLCPPCLRRYETSRRLATIAWVVSTIAGIGGLALAAATHSPAPALLGLLVAGGALAGGQGYYRASRPRAVRTESGALAVDVPNSGRYEL